MPALPCIPASAHGRGFHINKSSMLISPRGGPHPRAHTHSEVGQDESTDRCCLFVVCNCRSVRSAARAAGAEGIAQFMPTTAARSGLADPFDPLQAIPASAQLLRQLKQQFGIWGLAAAAYNAGPKRVQNWLAKGGLLPRETRGYVSIITGYSAEQWRGSQAQTDTLLSAQRLPCRSMAVFAELDEAARAARAVQPDRTEVVPAAVPPVVVRVRLAALFSKRQPSQSTAAPLANGRVALLARTKLPPLAKNKVIVLAETKVSLVAKTKLPFVAKTKLAQLAQPKV